MKLFTPLHRLPTAPASSLTLLFLAWLAILAGCAEQTTETEKRATPKEDASAMTPMPIDGEAIRQTSILLHNLHEVKDRGFLFGHQDSLAYGVQWMDEQDRSDVKDVTGDYPALYGWDVGNLELGDAVNLDKVPFSKMQDWIKQAYGRGGVVTISWHMNHPATGESSWDAKVGASELLPGGNNHRDLRAHLDAFADFVRELKATNEEGEMHLIPIIFRPWHEHNGDWFWWGKGRTSEDDYVTLWRFTVDYLRQEKQLHNLLYAYSPDRSRLDMDNFRQSYLYAYPGDDYVDVLGIDNYWDLGHPNNDAPKEKSRAQFVQSLEKLVSVATEKNKLAAMTEGGQDTVQQDKFWTQTLLAGVLANEQTRKIAYVQVWRNANREREGRDHFYVPYKGHSSEADFLEFYQHPATFFESDLPAMYEE